jgi:hypothetical protein
MAPSASDPKDLKLVLNPARRKALTVLIRAIVSHMRSKIEQSFEPSPEAEIAPLFVDRNNSRDRNSSPSSDPEAEARQQRLEARIEKSLSTRKLLELRAAALRYFDEWANEVRLQLRKHCDGPEDARSEQRRREWNAARNPPPPAYTGSSSDAKTPEEEEQALQAEAREVEEAKDISMLQSMYHPIPTRLTTISKEDRKCVISCMVLLLLSLGHYSAHSRVLLCYLTSSFAIPLSILTKEETEIAQTLMLASKALSADAETKKRQAENASARRWKVGLASVAGAAVIGITGGLAAPVVAGAIGGIMGGVGLGGVASFLGIFAMNGALMGSLFGALGGRMTGEMVDAYAKEVEDFKFLPIASEWGEFATKQEAEAEGRRLRVSIGINGWLNDKDDVIKPWRVMGRDSEVFALQYEVDALLELGKSLQNMVSSYAWSYVKLEILKRTVLATLWSALWPVYLLKMATSIDNPFAVARNRSEKAGEVLADALINKAQGERPVTLIGYSLGARVIYSCLRSLAERKAFGLVESVVFIGAPMPSNANNWRVMRNVVSGKVFNVFSENDYILAFLYRATSIQFGVAGLQEIADVEGVENMNLSKEVSGHLRYPELIGKILKRSGFEGIGVEDMEIEGDVKKEIELIDVDVDEMKGALDAKGLNEKGILELIESEPVAAGSAAGPSSRTVPRPRERERDRDVSDLTRGMSDMDVVDRPSDSERWMPDMSRRDGHEDSDSDDGGIQMVDNDSDGELQEIPGIPERYDDLPADPRDNGKVPAFEEQKSLGSFPRDNTSTRARTRASDMGLY